jgi:RHS repeat-associated protein
MKLLFSSLKSVRLAMTVCFALVTSISFSQVSPPSKIVRPPSNVIAIGRCSVIDLSWSASKSATSYNIYRSDNTNGIYELAGSSVGTTFRDQGREGIGYLLTYYYKITSVSLSTEPGSLPNESGFSTVATATTLPPINYITANQAGTSNMVRWGAVTGSSKLYCYRGRPWVFGQLVAEFATTPTNYLDREASRQSRTGYRLYSQANGWETGEAHSSSWSQADILPCPIEIDPNPTNGSSPSDRVLPQALTVPDWMIETIPADSSSAPSGGPSSAIRVNLAHGVASVYAPGVTALNPVGTDISFSLHYRTALSAGNVSSRGLPTGWCHNWDIRILQDGDQPGWGKSFRLVYPNGASEILIPNLDASGNPIGTFQVPIGAQYVAKGVFTSGSNSIGKWDSITISGNDETKQVFIKDSADTFYRLTSQVDSNGTSALDFTYSGGKLVSINNGRNDLLASSINIFYNNNDGFISQVKSYGGNFNTANFTRQYTVNSGNLTAVSKLNQSSNEWTYGFDQINGRPYLNSVSTVTPSGAMASATVSYSLDSGRVQNITDAVGNVRTYNYSVSEIGSGNISVGARVTTIKDTVGNTFDENTVICDELGRETVSKDRLGAATTITYGVESDPSAVTRVQPPIGNASIAEYDSHGNMTKATAPYGNYTRYTWEYPVEAPLGRLTKVQDFGNNGQSGGDGTAKTPTTYVYYVQGQQNYLFQPTNSGPVGLLKQINFPNGGFLKYYYANNGNVMGVAGIENCTFSYLWGNTGQILIGRPTSVTEPVTGITATYQYEPGTFRPVSIGRPLGEGISVEYNEYGQVKKTNLPGSKSISIAYGINGRASSSAVLTTPQGNTSLYTNTYNGESILSSSKDGLNNMEQQTTNASLGLNAVSNGNSTTMHQFTPNTNQRTVDYRIGTGNNAVGYQTTFNEMGNATSTKQTLPSVSNIGTSTYRFEDPNMLDSTASLNSSTYASNFNTSYVYDEFGRVSTAQSTGTTTGQTSSTAVPYTITHVYTYDNEDQILTDGGIKYTYNMNGTLNTMTIGSIDVFGNRVQYTYGYDAQKRTTQISANLIDFYGNQLSILASASYIYDALDRVTHVWTSYGVTKYIYDSESRVTALYNLRSDSKAAAQYQIPVELPGGGMGQRAVLSGFTNITYDKLNNRSGMSIALATMSGATAGSPTVFKTGAVTFGYDDGSRLTSEVWEGEIVGGTTVAYIHAYDNADNLTTLRSGGLTVDVASDLLTTSGYSYNSFGDCETWGNIAVNGTSTTLSASSGWDPTGQLTRVSGPTAITNAFGSTITEQMAYDDQGRRTYKRVYGYKVQSSTPSNYSDGYTYSGNSLIIRSSLGKVNLPFGNSTIVGNDFSDKAQILYIVGPTGPVVEFDAVGNKADITYDPQGSTVATNKGGSLFSSPWMLYDAYGKPVAKHPSMTIDEASRISLNQPLQYKGQYGYIADAHTGTYYCTHRYYDPNTGRWLSRDPIGLEGGTNTYLYCGGNPVMRSDASGLECTIFGFEFSGEVFGNGTRTGGSAVLHVFSFGKYTNKWAEQQPGYKGAIVLSEVAFEALSTATGEVAFVKGGQLFLKGKKAYEAYKLSSKMRKIKEIGDAGEKIVAQIVNLGTKEGRRYFINGRGRVADGIDWALGHYYEIKNVVKLDKIKQITDGIQYARNKGLTYNLYVRKGTVLSKPLQKLVDSGDVILHRILK